MYLILRYSCSCICCDRLETSISGYKPKFGSSSQIFTTSSRRPTTRNRDPNQRSTPHQPTLTQPNKFPTHHVHLPNARRAREKRRRAQSQRSGRASPAAVQMDANDPRRRHHGARAGQHQRQRPRRRHDKRQTKSRDQRPTTHHRRPSPRIPSSLSPPPLPMHNHQQHHEYGVWACAYTYLTNPPTNHPTFPPNRAPSQNPSTPTNQPGRSKRRVRAKR